MPKTLLILLGIIFLQVPARAQTTMTGLIQTSDGIHSFYAVNNGGLGGPPFFPGQPGAAALNTNRTQAQAWEIFTLVQLANQRFRLQTSGGDWVTAVNGGGIGGPNDNTSPIHTNAGASEVGLATIFIITPVGSTPDDVTIQTCDGHFVTANDGGGFFGPDQGAGLIPIHTDAPTSRAAGPWETFTLVPTPTCFFDQIEIQGETGYDNADRNLAISASVAGQIGELCIKTSNDPSIVPPTFLNMPIGSTWAGCPAGQPNSSFAVGSTFDTGKVTLRNPQPLSGFSNMVIRSVQSGCIASCANWALQAVTVTVSNSSGLIPPMVLSNIPSAGNPNGDNCVAYFKAPPNATEVKFNLNGTTPLSTWVDGTSSEMGTATSCKDNGG